MTNSRQPQSDGFTFVYQFRGGSSGIQHEFVSSENHRRFPGEESDIEGWALGCFKRRLAEQLGIEDISRHVRLLYIFPAQPTYVLPPITQLGAGSLSAT